jgi:undecaprenyl-diphosphatase
LINFVVHLDRTLALYINSFTGRIDAIDWLLKGLANDYFLPVIFGLILFCLWFSVLEEPYSNTKQKTVVRALISLGLSNGLVAFCNFIFFRSRPFTEIVVRTLINKPSDSSFPSNMATFMFAVAFSVWLGDRKVGSWMLILAAIAGFGRVYVGMHYPSDIIAGALIGALIAIIVNRAFFVIRPFYDFIIDGAKRLYLA